MKSSLPKCWPQLRSVAALVRFLKKQEIEFVIEQGGVITWKGEEWCPIHAAYHFASDSRLDSELSDEQYEKCSIDVFSKGERMGMSEELIQKLIAAADNKPDHSPRTRAKLLSLIAEAP